MKKGLLFLIVVGLFSVAAFYTGIAMERLRSRRDDHVVHASLIVAIAKANEAGNSRAVKRLSELQMLAALRCTVNESDIIWTKYMFEFPQETGVRSIFMPAIADYVNIHPEIRLTEAERSQILKYLGKNEGVGGWESTLANHSPDPTPASVTPVAGQPPRQP
jgi:hypothetical protein